MEKIKPCPFCGGEPNVYGQEIRDYVNGEWAKETRKEYWIQPFCHMTCMFAMLRSTAYGVIGGVRYTSPEAAIKAWNKRVDDGKQDES